jgi:GNAT superfamily N-acetyltransferase
LIAQLAESVYLTDLFERKAAKVGTKRTWGKPPKEYQVIRIKKGWKRVSKKQGSKKYKGKKLSSKSPSSANISPASTESPSEMTAAALAAISKEAKKPNAAKYHKNFSLGEFGVKDQKVKKYSEFSLRKSNFEEAVSQKIGKRITLEELSHGFAVPDGFTATLTGMSDRLSSISWKITDSEGAFVGDIIRSFGTTYKGESYIQHDSLFLKPEYRGKGISDTINGNALRHYEKWGIEEIQVDAVQIGRYAWARLGFNFASPPEMLRQFNEFSNLLPLKIQKKSREIAKRLVNEPWKLAKWDIGLKIDGNPIGKAFLLTTAPWKGNIKVDRKNEGYLNAISKSKVAV